MAIWDIDFYPSYTPFEMLEMGVFGGLYLNSDREEYPVEWFEKAKLSQIGVQDSNLNYYKVLSGQPLHVWREKGWIHTQDPKGWFQWYCRYYRGRRSVDDQRQIKRWKSFIARHRAQVFKNAFDEFEFNNDKYRPVQKQGLLQWAWDYRQDPKDMNVRKMNLEKLKRDIQEEENDTCENFK